MKTGLRTACTATSLIAFLTALGSAPALAQTMPTGGAYVAGSGGIASAGSKMTITQSTTRGIIDWNGFSIGTGGSVMFDNGTGATLNRVTGGNLSEIDGALSGTGSIFLINPNGVVIGPDGTVVTGGSFVASSRDVSNSQFMNGGALKFSGSSSGTVTNLGKIVSQNGDVVLIGEAATNAGSISAPKGTAAVAAGNEVVLSAENGPAGVYVAPDTTTSGDSTNTGTIKAAAAALASAGGNVYALAGNTRGLIQASGTETVNGQVWLTAPNGSVNVQNTTVAASDANGNGGTIIANGKNVSIGAGAVISANGQVSGASGGTVLVGVSAPGGVDEARRTVITSHARITATGGAGGAGGHIETSGQRLILKAAQVDAGTGGSWVLDPVDMTVDATAATSIDNALGNNTTVTLTTTSTNASSTPSGIGMTSSGAGDIVIAAPISWSTSATLTLSAYANVDVDASIKATGAGVLDITYGNASTNSPAGAALLFGTGGSIQFTGQDTTTSAPLGSLTIEGNAYTLVQNVAELQNINSNNTGAYALAEPIDAGGTTYPGPLVSSFSGNFNGLGNTIANLTINDTTTPFVGLFGFVMSPGMVENVGVTGNSVTGTVPGANVGGLVGFLLGGSGVAITGAYTTGAVTGGIGSNVGGLVGFSNGTITDAYATSSVIGGTSSNVGGLAGGNFGGTITDAYATGTITGTSATNVGGLVGFNNSKITDAYATGTVAGTSATNVGGLVGGTNSGAITDAYATGTVTGGSGSYSTVGGLVGSNGGTITDAYATGMVTGTSTNYVAGLVGNNNAAITDAYATGAVTGGSNSTVGGLVGSNGGTVTASYFDTDTTGTTSGVGGGTTTGVTGLQTLQWLTQGPIASGTWDTTTTWVTGYPYPVLQALPYALVTATGTTVYGAAPTASNVTVTGQGGVSETGLVDTSGTTWLTSAGPLTQADVGTYSPIGGTGGTVSPGYQLTYNGALRIDPALLTITADSQISVYGQTPSLGDTAFTTSGLLNGDMVSTVTLSTDATSTSKMWSTWNITPSNPQGTGLSNYKITYGNGTLTIVPSTNLPPSVCIGGNCPFQ